MREAGGQLEERHERLILALFPPLLLAACGPKENDPGPGGVTVGEARALDEAAEMLDSRTDPPPLPEATPTAQSDEASAQNER